MRLISFAIVTVLFAAAPVRAQSWEASGVLGFTPSAPIDRQASELTGLDIRGDFTWGVQGARFFTPALGAEVLWTQQSSALEIETADGSADLFAMTIRHLDGHVVYQLGDADATWRPFVFGGLGATWFSADTLETETKLSFSLGGGVKFVPWRSIGARMHIRYKPVILSDGSSGDFCDPFGFCQGTLQQFEFAGGVVVRF
jgi:opacity protein-like surface antigen